jgi:sulfate adenylyltransferase large subunit
MATGASTAELAIVLVDARHGVREQTRRHARIAELLGISNFVLAVNKMDLVAFDRSVFDRIEADFSELVSDATLVHAIPLSALHGDNIVRRSERTPWFERAPLLEHLETIDVRDGLAAQPFRLPVQLVVRPDQDFRGYAGRIASGTIRRGDQVTVWPSGLSTRVDRIVTWEGDLDAAFAPMSVTLTLEDDVDVSRGDIFASGPLQVGRSVEANVVWMDERPLDPSRVYLLKHATRTVTAEVHASLQLNEIGTVTVTTARPLVFDPYTGNRATGSFVLIDPGTNATAGAGMIVRAVNERRAGLTQADAASRIALAARSASSERPGSESLIANHAYSARCFPLKSALRGLPVRISPGQTVVTYTPSLSSSARNPSDSPTRANLLAL